MIYTVRTARDINIVKSELEAHAKKVGYSLLNTYEFKKILKNKGYPIQKDVTVYEICNPAGAQHALEYLSEISVYLPCRISVYENNDVTYLSTIGLEEIVHSFETDERFKHYMSTLFDNLKKIMHSWDK